MPLSPPGLVSLHVCLSGSLGIVEDLLKTGI